jgi:hypothetical protein
MQRSRSDALLGTGGATLLASMHQLAADNALRLRIAAVPRGRLQPGERGLPVQLRRRAARGVPSGCGARRARPRRREPGGPAGRPGVDLRARFNLKIARALGPAVPPAIRLRADRLLE